MQAGAYVKVELANSAHISLLRHQVNCKKTIIGY